MSNYRVHHDFDSSINIVRFKCLEIIESDQFDSKSVHKNDINEIKTSDSLIRRFLVSHSGDVDQSTQALISAMKYYQEMNFHEMDESYFPAEIYAMGSMFLYEPDKDGRPTMYIRMKSCVRVPEIVEPLRHWVSWYIWKMDMASRENGFIVIVDFNGSSLKDYDMNNARFFVQTLKNYFPCGLQSFIGVDMLLIARGLWYLIKDLVPKNVQKLFIVTSKDKLTKFVPIEHIPDFLGGTCTRKYGGLAVAPQRSPTLRQFAICELKLSHITTDRVLKTLGPIIQKIIDENSHVDKL